MSLHTRSLPSFEVRPYDETLAVACWEILHHAVHAIDHPNYTLAQKSAWSASTTPPMTWASRLTQSRPYLLFSKPPTGPAILIGFAELTAEGYIDCFYLHPSYQRQGGGHHLLSALTLAAKKQGSTQLSVDAALPAVPFFQQFGFQWRTVNTVQRTGIPLMNVSMQKPLC